MNPIRCIHFWRHWLPWTEYDVELRMCAPCLRQILRVIVKAECRSSLREFVDRLHGEGTEIVGVETGRHQ